MCNQISSSNFFIVDFVDAAVLRDPATPRTIARNLFVVISLFPPGEKE